MRKKILPLIEVCALLSMLVLAIFAGCIGQPDETYEETPETPEEPSEKLLMKKSLPQSLAHLMKLSLRLHHNPVLLLNHIPL